VAFRYDKRDRNTNDRVEPESSHRPTAKKLPVSRSSDGMMCAFSTGGIDGKGKAAFGLGVVERGCEESAGFCQREAFRASGG
jgi:hypothetical protein